MLMFDKQTNRHRGKCSAPPPPPTRCSLRRRGAQRQADLIGRSANRRIGWVAAAALRIVCRAFGAACNSCQLQAPGEQRANCVRHQPQPPQRARESRRSRRKRTNRLAAAGSRLGAPLGRPCKSAQARPGGARLARVPVRARGMRRRRHLRWLGALIAQAGAEPRYVITRPTLGLLAAAAARCLRAQRPLCAARAPLSSCQRRRPLIGALSAKRTAAHYLNGTRSIIRHASGADSTRRRRRL